MHTLVTDSGEEITIEDLQILVDDAAAQDSPSMTADASKTQIDFSLKLPELRLLVEPFTVKDQAANQVLRGQMVKQARYEAGMVLYGRRLDEAA